MKNKGFTLVELLAIILILGLLAIFIVPKVKDLFNDSKEKIAEENVKRLIGVFEEYYVKSSIDDHFTSCSYNFDTGINTCSNLGITGDLPSSGFIEVSNDGKINGSVIVDNYSFSIDDGFSKFLGISE